MGLYLRKDNTNKLRNKFYLIIQENVGYMLLFSSMKLLKLLIHLIELDKGKGCLQQCFQMLNLATLVEKFPGEDSNREKYLILQALNF